MQSIAVSGVTGGAVMGDTIPGVTDTQPKKLFAAEFYKEYWRSDHVEGGEGVSDSELAITIKRSSLLKGKTRVTVRDTISYCT